MVPAVRLFHSLPMWCLPITVSSKAAVAVAVAVLNTHERLEVPVVADAGMLAGRQVPANTEGPVSPVVLQAGAQGPIRVFLEVPGVLADQPAARVKMALFG